MDSLYIKLKAIELKHDNYKVVPNQELIAIGLGNIVGSFFQTYPATGGLSRTAVNNQVGANTPLAALISGMIVGFTLLFLTPVFYYLPQAVVAAIIMVAVFLSFIGVFLGLMITGKPFVIMMTMMGIISLAGIVVNNGVVLLDYTDLLIARKREELGVDKKELLSNELVFEAIVKGGKARLRPVLLTAITTVLGLVPLAIGFNIDFFSLFASGNPNIYMGGDNVIFWGPLAWTVIYGLIFATFLTLIVVPVLFYLVNRIKIKLKNRSKNKEIIPTV